ncbi:MAG: hypothetical protein KUG69_14860 [Marinosulfonomonas sp.]|nr:hypothetical protein [Marinosulfonomonas sp.]
MTFVGKITILSAVLALSACEGPIGGLVDKTLDRGIDAKSLTQLQAGIWIDPNGCDHWIIDDGIEGYLSQRLSRDGKPVCSGKAMSNTAIGGFKSGSNIRDSI